MEQRSRRTIGTSAAALLFVAAGCAAPEGDGQVPLFEVNALWPQPLEYPYILGPVSGLDVAPDGNILVVTRQDGFNQGNEINSVTGTGDCCTPTQAVLEYAPDGSLVREWGGPDQGYPWPARPHGIAIDPDGNLWIGGGVAVTQPGRGGGPGGGGAGGAPPAGPTTTYDTHILKFSREGQHLLTIGEEGGTPSNASETSFGGAARFSFGDGEVYVADGYANNRVVVLDMETGEFIRQWGAYGNAPEDTDLPPYDAAAEPAQQFRSVTCAELSNDDLVYVCDRGNNRLQVFETDGSFVNEVIIAPNTLGNGSVWDVAFSPDDDQRFLYVADGMNERVYILERESLTVLTDFGIGGRYPGNFLELGSIEVDAAGNIYTAENGQGRRVQKFVYLGMGAVPAEHQGALYPGAATAAAPQ